MTTRREDDERLPPLPDAARFAIAAFRNERPSPELEQRLLDGALDGEDARARLPVRRRRAAKVAVLAAAALLLAATAQLVRARLSPQAPVTELAVQLDDDGGAWVSMPWKVGVHPLEPTFVKLDVPEAMVVQQHALDAAPRVTSCKDDRCVHRWVLTPHARNQPLMVRVSRPGRHEVRLAHSSSNRDVSEHFVIVATR